MGNTKSYLEQRQGSSKTSRRPFAPWNTNKRISSSNLLLQQPSSSGGITKASSSSPLQELILRKDWQRVLCRVKLHPMELRSYFKFQVSPTHSVKILPLHLACALEPPLPVVQVMLEHYVDSASLAIAPAKKKKLRRRRRLRNTSTSLLDETREDAQQSLLSAPDSFLCTATSKSIPKKETWDSSPDATSQSSSISSHETTNKTVILQLSPSGKVHPMPVQTETMDTETTISSLFCVQWDLEPLFAHVTDEGVLLPLHIACFFGADATVVQALADAYPAAALCDVMGMLPIHWLAAGWNVATESPLEALRVLKRTVPDSVRIRSGSHGMTPSEYVQECMEECNIKESCLKEVEELDEEDDDNSSTGGSLIFGSDDDSSFEGHETMTAMSTTCISRLLEEHDWEAMLAAVEGEPDLARQWIYGLDDSGPSVWKRLPLHVACAHEAPLGLILVLIQAFPDALQLTDPRDGSSPLHLCCKNNAPLPVIKLLLERSPSSVLNGDVNGRLPLHIAILAKASYATVEALVEEYPATVLTKDFALKAAVDYATVLYEKRSSVRELLVGLSTMLNEYKVLDTSGSVEA